jgi:KipI family sensor histidine kinase inhibitor
MKVALEPLGDRAFLASFATEQEAVRWAASIRAREIRGVTDVVLAYRSVAVFADPDLADLGQLELTLGSLKPVTREPAEGKLIEIPVLYDGPDLDIVASRLSLDTTNVVALHTGSVYDVFAIGFLQGFPYAGYLPRPLSGLPRRDEPRVEVAAGSVAIAGRQTGIYPCACPGGWHLLGRTPLQIADPDEGRFPIRTGDRIRFRAINSLEFEAKRDERL